MRILNPSRFILAGLLVQCATAAESFPGPWRDSFALQVEGQARTVAVTDTGSWLVISRADLLAGRFLGGSTEVVLVSKLERSADGLRLAGMPEVLITGDSAAWRGVADGDNTWVFGRLSRTVDGGPLLTVLATASAPSDRQRITQRNENIAPTDWTARLAAAAWVRDQAASESNKEFWLAAADEAVVSVVEDAIVSAQATRDLKLVDQALDWCVTVIGDPGLAGRVLSVPWLTSEKDPTLAELHRTLRRMGLELYKDRWRIRAEALSLTFEDRFQAVAWNDAEAFFRLGRWADVNAEKLPLAKDRAYRAYRAGQRADPRHEGIRSALGADAALATAENALHPTESGVTTEGADVTQGTSAPSETPVVAAEVKKQGKPNDLELGREGWQVAQRLGVVTAWMRSPRANEDGLPAQIELLFWNDGQDIVTIAWATDYAGEARNAAIRLESRKRFATTVPVIYRANAAPAVTLALTGP